jgi:hypothetical protein
MAKFDRKSAYKRTVVENVDSSEEATSQNYVSKDEARYRIYIRINGVMPRNGALTLDPLNLHTEEEIQAQRDMGKDKTALYMERQNKLMSRMMELARHSETGEYEFMPGIIIISLERKEEIRNQRYGWDDFDSALDQIKGRSV